MISWRSISSPGRVEKYGPPFMGFLRSNTNSNGRSTSRSRSRGRSRASPLFVRRNKSAVTQEPSSPKVTCMGQVRVSRSKPRIQPESPENKTRKCCNWIRNPPFHVKFAGKIKKLLFCPKWRMLLCLCSRRKLKNDSPTTQLDRPATELVREIGYETEEGGESLEISKLFVSPTMTSPKDSFLLTRSKSAPYSSSSLAFRFWEENNQCEHQNVSSEITESEVPTENINFESVNIERNEVDVTKLGLVRRPVLTRSMSEPAKEDDDDVASGSRRRLGYVLSLTQFH